MNESKPFKTKELKAPHGYSNERKETDCFFITKNTEYWKMIKQLNELLKEHKLYGLRWSESQKKYVEAQCHFSVGDDLWPNLYKSGIPIRYAGDNICPVTDTEYDRLVQYSKNPSSTSETEAPK